MTLTVTTSHPSTTVCFHSFRQKAPSKSQPRTTKTQVHNPNRKRFHRLHHGREGKEIIISLARKREKQGRRVGTAVGDDLDG
ncbi:hypothetical protein VIGAN_01202500 [Vigna angularis var. angularis]|uniref:Uncharacterized protein n=1 Tax=Vigna angularis var. angularis TaxID=157739 RepID=A0A0S3R1C4_PHAAN|nr:hypothetical protein VIGAN_01202500 [Vigna angularis var. angularis]